MNKQELIEKSLIDMIEQHTFHEGDRIFSVREMAKIFQISVTPVLAAYQHLESIGVLQARPKSGYYVAVQNKKGADRMPDEPVELFDVDSDLQTRLFTKVSQAAFDRTVKYPFALSQLSPHLANSRKIADCMTRALRNQELLGDTLCYREDTRVLQDAIAADMKQYKCCVSPSDIRITVGPTQAILLGLFACCRRGDCVAIECPGNHYLYLAAKLFGARIIPVTSSPETGLDIDCFTAALSEQPIRCLICSPNFSCPTGSLMPFANKHRLLEICALNHVTVIEDDIDGKFSFGMLHPIPMKSLDETNVIYVSTIQSSIQNISFISGGKYQERIRAFGEVSRACVPAIFQYGFADYLSSSAYRQNLNEVRKLLCDTVSAVRREILAAFPAGTQVSAPQGGYSLWVTLPNSLNALTLLEAAQPLGITFTLGATFSGGTEFYHCLRINCSTLVGRPEQLEGIRLLGSLAQKYAAKAAIR